MIIYCITNKVNGKKYVGQTVRNLNTRWAQHVNQSKRLDYLLYRAFKKHGLENFNIEQIDDALSKTELDEKEKVWITRLSTLAPNGYNCIAGAVGGMFSECTVEKLRTASKRMWTDTDYREKVIRAKSGTNHHFYGKSLSEGHKKRLSESHKGTTLPDEQKAKIGSAAKRLWKDADYRNRATKGFQEYNESQKKPVVNLDTGEVYGSVTEAAIQNGLSQQNLSKVCQGVRKRTGGHRWTFQIV